MDKYEHACSILNVWIYITIMMIVGVNMEYNPYSREISNSSSEKNIFKTYELPYSTGKELFFNYIIPFLKKEYGISEDLPNKIKNVNEKRRKNLEQFILKHKSPNPAIQAPGNNGWLKNTRSKLPELIARDLLIEKHGVKFSSRISLEEEDPDMPKRGIDNFGFIFDECNGNISLKYIVACEVKASDEAKSPPSVVHDSKDSLFNSLKNITSLDERFCKAIASTVDRLPPSEYVELITSIALDIEEDNDLEAIKKKIIAAPFMIRARQCWTEADYGKFKSHCNEIVCSNIAYYIITLDYDLVKFADEVYEKLRES